MKKLYIIIINYYTNQNHIYIYISVYTRQKIIYTINAHYFFRFFTFIFFIFLYC